MSKDASTPCQSKATEVCSLHKTESSTVHRTVAPQMFSAGPACMGVVPHGGL